MMISIDIGTSYSSVCVSGPDGKAQPVDVGTGTSIYGGKYSLPSAVYVEESGNVLVGQAAMNSRRRSPGNFRMEFKRDLGQDVPILLGNEEFLPEDLYTELFRHMKECAEKVGGPAELAYLTCPAAFGRKKREKILEAAKAAGLPDARLVDEPTAAAMDYCAQGFVKDGQKLMVYDFGGGTFDVSLIHYKNGEFLPLAEPYGLERCGGIDLDRLIYQDMMDAIGPELLESAKGSSLHWMRLESQLAELAVKAKHQLSTAEEFEEDIPIGFDMVVYRLSVQKFNQMAAGLVGRSIAACREVLRSAKMQVGDVSAILMVGGTSRVALVQEMVRQFADGVPVLYAEDLELAVARGALNYHLYRKREEAEAEARIDDSEAALNRSWKAAVSGDAEGQFRLGDCYYWGRGIAEDAKEAVRWYQKAAGQGHPGAQYNLGLFSQYGRCGLPKDEEKAVEWYRKAAEGGLLEAQYSLGLCFQYGRGVEKDCEAAKEWYQKAAGQGFSSAEEKLKELADGGVF